MRTVAVLLGFAASACAGFSHQPPPGPSPVPEAWHPEEVLRERLPPGNGRDVVLDDADGLSPDEAAVLAVDRNPRLRAVRAERGIGQAELLAAGVLPNPKVNGSIDFPVSGEEAKVLGYGAGLSWNVTPLVSRGARVSAAEENLASVDLDIAWQEWQVAQAARLHTIRAIYLERSVRLARERESIWQKRLDGLREARLQGAVTQLEVSSAERSLADARVSRLQLGALLVSERGELNRTLGVDPAREIDLDMSFAPRAEETDGGPILADVPRRRLDLLALQHAQRSRDEGLRAAVLGQFPPVEIGFHARREVDGNASLGLALTFELPFFERNQAAVARESARRVQVEAEYEARLLEARAEVLRAVKEMSLVREQVAAARQSAAAASRLAEQARSAALSGALSPLLAADILERSQASQLRAVEIEQTLAELEVALALASGQP